MVTKKLQHQPARSLAQVGPAYGRKEVPNLVQAEFCVSQSKSLDYTKNNEGQKLDEP